MHQDIMDALNLAGRRRGYDDGGTVANNMMSDDPTQQFMANLARAGFSQDQINSIIGSQSPQTNQTPAQAPQAPMPPSTGNQPSDNPFGLQSYAPDYYPGGGQPDLTPPPGSIAVDQGGPWGRFGPPQLDYPPQQPPMAPYQGDGGASFGINWGNPEGLGGTGTKAGGGSPQPIPDPSYPGHSLGYRPMPPRGYFPNQGAPGNPQYPPIGGGTGTKAGGSAPMGGGMGGGAPIQGAYGNPQYAPLGGGSKAGGPANPFAPNMPGGYGAPPSFYPPQGGGNPYGGGAGHKGGGAGHKGGGGGGMFGG